MIERWWQVYCAALQGGAFALFNYSVDSQMNARDARRLHEHAASLANLATGETGQAPPVLTVHAHDLEPRVVERILFEAQRDGVCVGAVINSACAVAFDFDPLTAGKKP